MVRTPAQGGGGTTPVYANPFRKIVNLMPSRIDMGVDYGGSGPVYPIGNAVITEVDQSWAGGFGAVGPGTFISYRFTDGPLKDKYWYTAENIQPAVKVGQHVTPDQPIGYAQGGFETGFAKGPSAPGETMAAASGQIPSSGDPGAWSTGWGIAASDVLAATGAPPGSITTRTTASGSTPSGWDTIITAIGGLVGTVVGGGLSGGGPLGFLGGLTEIGHWLGVAVTDLTDIHMYISLGWLFLGFLLLLLGLYWWIRTSKGYKALESNVTTTAAAAAL